MNLAARVRKSKYSPHSVAGCFVASCGQGVEIHKTSRGSGAGLENRTKLCADPYGLDKASNFFGPSFASPSVGGGGEDDLSGNSFHLIDGLPKFSRVGNG